LSSSAPLPSLEELDARGCSSLSQDDLDQLQASCPQCEFIYGALDVDAQESDATVESGVLSRMLRCSEDDWSPYPTLNYYVLMPLHTFCMSMVKCFGYPEG
jgi:hypothetical protein